MNTIRELKQQEKYKNMLKRKNKEKNIYKIRNETLKIKYEGIKKVLEKKEEEIERLNNKLLLIKGVIRTPRALDKSLAYAMVKTQIENILGSDKE